MEANVAAKAVPCTYVKIARTHPTPDRNPSFINVAQIDEMPKTRRRTT